MEELRNYVSHLGPTCNKSFGKKVPHEWEYGCLSPSLLKHEAMELGENENNNLLPLEKMLSWEEYLFPLRKLGLIKEPWSSEKMKTIIFPVMEKS